VTPRKKFETKASKNKKIGAVQSLCGKTKKSAF